MPNPIEDLRLSADAWGKALRSLGDLAKACDDGNFEAAEAHRHTTVAHVEASLDLMVRAHRVVRHVR